MPMSATGFLQLLTGLWLVAGVAGEGFGGDDFANNLFSDLAPILSLFGEKVTMQFMSQSMGWADNVILAMVPLGIMTAVVGAIRVGGPTWLRALIGRARESRAIVESDLMSSTSHEVCELWNGQQIVRVMGEAEVREFIILVGEDSDHTPSGDYQDDKFSDAEPNEGFDAETKEIFNVEVNEQFDAKDNEEPERLSISECFDAEENEETEGSSINERSDAEENEEMEGSSINGRSDAEETEEPEGSRINGRSDAEENEEMEGSSINERFDAEETEEPEGSSINERLDAGNYSEDSDDSRVMRRRRLFAKSNEEPEESNIDAAENLEFVKLRDDEKKQHLAEYWPSAWDIISGGFSPRHKGLVRKHGIPIAFGARKRAAATDIEKSIPAGDPDEIFQRPVAVVRNTEVHTPNMSLNIGNTSTSRETYVVAVIGTFLQVGLLVYAGLTATYFRDNTQFQDKPPDSYAFPCMAVGTLMLVPGMLICGHVVESSTSERRYRPANGKEARVVWLQRSGVVNDQSFKSFAIFPTKAQRAIVTSQRSKQDRNSTSEESSVGLTVEVTTLVATVITICGFVVQFVGLRGMNWSVSIAQLAAILIMAVLRSLVRRNLAERPNSQPLPREHELDWLAMTIANPSIAPWLHPDMRARDDAHDDNERARPWTKPSCWDYQIMNVQDPNTSGPGVHTDVRKSKAHQAMLIRRDLGALANWRGPASAEAISLACAIEIVMNTLIGIRRYDALSWHLTASSCGVHEPVAFRATREEESWSTSADDIEAALSLWLYSASYREIGKEKETMCGPVNRLRGAALSQTKRPLGDDSLIMLGSFDARILKRDLDWWLPGNNSIREVVQLATRPVCTPRHPWRSKVEVETHRVVGFAQDDTDWPPTDIDVCEYKTQMAVSLDWSDDHSTLAVPSQMDLKKLYAHHLFATFMWAVSAAAADILSKDPSLSHPFGQAEIRASHGSGATNEPLHRSFKNELYNEKLSTLVRDIETTGLGPVNDIYFGILPPLSALSLLPPVHVFLKRGLERGHHREQQGSFREAAYVYTMLLEMTELFPQNTCNTDIASEATALVMEQVRAFTEIAKFQESQLFPGNNSEQDLSWVVGQMKEQLAKRHDPAFFHRLMGLYERQGRVWKCDLVLGDNGTYPTILPPEFGFGALHEAACDNSSGYSDDRGMNQQDSLGWTPVHYAVACGSRYLLFNDLLMSRPDVNVRDVRGRTPLHYAYRHDDEEVVEDLLRAGADLNCKDAEGMTPLHDAVKNGARRMAATLIKWGADMNALDNGGRTPLAWALCSGNADIGKEILWDATSKSQRDDKGRTMLHMAITWEGGMEKDFGDLFGFLVPGVDKDGKDHAGYTPLHLAAAKGHLLAVQWLISQGANPHAHDGMYPNSRTDKYRRNITPLRVAENRLHMMTPQRVKEGENTECESESRVEDARGSDVDEGGIAEKEGENTECESESRVEDACGSDVDEGGIAEKGEENTECESESRVEDARGSDVDEEDGAEQANILRHQLEVKRLEDVIQYLMAFGNGPGMRDEDGTGEDDTLGPCQIPYPYPWSRERKVYG